MIILLFILLLSCIAFLYLYYNKKIDILRKQLIINRNKYSSRQKTNINRTRNSKLLINFTSPPSASGTLKAQSNIYLSPLYDSYILKSINIDTDVIILDCAELNNETWFYINLPESTPVNSKGWVNSKHLSLTNTDI